jgi:hypothetical protein
MLIVGVCEVELAIEDNFSLKGKRSVVKKVIDRCQQKYNLAIAEVDANDELARAVLGFAVVGNDSRFVNSMVDKIVQFIDEVGDAPVTHHSFEIINF